MPIEIPLLLFLFFLNAYVSGGEIALVALGSHHMHAIAERHPRWAPTLEVWRKQPSQMITTILVTSNITIIAFSSVATALSLKLAETYQWDPLLVSFVTLGVSGVAVLFTEIAPKVVAKRHPARVAVLVIPGLIFVEKVLGPFIRLLVKAIRALTRPFGGEEGDSLPLVTEEDLVRVVDESARGGAIETEEKEMIRSVLEFGDTVVKDVMIPRTQVEGVAETASVEECLERFIDSGATRLPVYRENLDQIIGLLYAKDFLAVLKMRDLVILRDVLRPVFFVPETKPVTELLREFRKGRMHMAVVVDEYGGTSGLVTMEDLVEEIIGEIRDEYDQEAPLARRSPDGVWDVDAAIEIFELQRELGTEISDIGESTTLGGVLAERLGRIPRQGDWVTLGEWRAEVSASNDRVALRVTLRRPVEHA